eukprot:3691391-Amphidinium_carterae.1
MQLKGRALDLEAAFKQLRTHATKAHASCFVLSDPESGEPAILKSAALPFGSISSVHGPVFLSFVFGPSCCVCSSLRSLCLRLLRRLPKLEKRLSFDDTIKLLGKQ